MMCFFHLIIVIRNILSILFITVGKFEWEWHAEQFQHLVSDVTDVIERRSGS